MKEPFVEKLSQQVSRSAILLFIPRVAIMSRDCFMNSPRMSRSTRVDINSRGKYIMTLFSIDVCINLQKCKDSFLLDIILNETFGLVIDVNEIIYNQLRNTILSKKHAILIILWNIARITTACSMFSCFDFITYMHYVLIFYIYLIIFMFHWFFCWLIIYLFWQYKCNIIHHLN